jgi:hypothetical protein
MATYGFSFEEWVRERTRMQLAGVNLATCDAQRLAAMLTAAGLTATADTLARAWGEGDEVVPLTLAERDAILSVLDDPSSGLCELRAVLVAQRAWRRREGL